MYETTSNDTNYNKILQYFWSKQKMIQLAWNAEFLSRNNR